MKYRKKPVVIEAIQLNVGLKSMAVVQAFTNEAIEKLQSALSASKQRNRELLETLEYLVNKDLTLETDGIGNYGVCKAGKSGWLRLGATPLEAIQSAMKQKS